MSSNQSINDLSNQFRRQMKTLRTLSHQNSTQTGGVISEIEKTLGQIKQMSSEDFYPKELEREYRELLKEIKQ